MNSGFSPKSPVPHRADWVFEERLGRGGFGEVWRIRQTHFDRVEAIKFCLDDRARNVLANEGETLAALHRQLPAHPNLVAATAINLTLEPFWVAFEFVDGQPLDRLIAERGPMPWQTALDLFLGVCRGMAAAHAVGIVHRDLKPGNILVRAADGVPKITDFGLGRLLAEAAVVSGMMGGDETTSDDEAMVPSLPLSGPQSQQGGPLARYGTPMFMSPEQRAGEPATPADDVYALGAVLFQMLVGSPKKEPHYVRETLEELPVPPPASVIGVVVDCLSHPRLRPSSAGELAADVEAILHGESLPHRVDSKIMTPFATPSDRHEAVSAAERRSSGRADAPATTALSSSPQPRETEAEAVAVMIAIMLAGFYFVFGEMLGWIFGATVSGDVSRVLGAFSALMITLGVSRLLFGPFGIGSDFDGIAGLIGFVLGAIYGPEIAAMAGAEKIWQVAVVFGAASSIVMTQDSRNTIGIIKIAVACAVLTAFALWWVHHANQLPQKSPPPPPTASPTTITPTVPTTAETPTAAETPATTETPATGAAVGAGAGAKTENAVAEEWEWGSFYIFGYVPFGLTWQAWNEVPWPWSLIVCFVTGLVDFFAVVLLFLPSVGHMIAGIPGAVAGFIVMLVLMAVSA